MRRWHLALGLMVVSIPALPQIRGDYEGRERAQNSAALPSGANHTNKEGKDALELLKTAETEAAALDGEMRAWVLWQIGLGYQSFDRPKALDVFERAFVASRAAPEDHATAKTEMEVMAKITGHATLPSRLRLQADIARSIVLLDPKRSEQVLQQVDPAARGSVLVSVLASQEKEKQFDRALETLNWIVAQDEMPYRYALRLMDTLNPDQSSELTQLFVTALASYRDHAPHSQFKDEFAVMLTHYWNRLPKTVVREAIDEILKQVADADEKGSYSLQSGKGTITFGSLYEYRLSQIMPVLREFDTSAMRDYLEKYPALASVGTGDDVPLPATTGDARFHPTGGYATIMISMAEMPSAQKAAAKVDSGHTDGAIADAANITDLSLRAQTYEYIARVASAKNDSAAGTALEKMLQVADKLGPKDAFPYYSSAADIYLRLKQIDEAKNSIEAGLDVADKLYKTDADDDDPNTALKAFWPSTNAYCAMLRHAGPISHAWASSLLRRIRDPEIRVAAETELAGGWLNAPTGPITMMITKKNSSSESFAGRE
ncbi:MAG TPA: hypothetical protein VI685_29485 [Candidatus Angelobacter sp.]